jgi:HSF-type DNA-binding
MTATSENRAAPAMVLATNDCNSPSAPILQFAFPRTGKRGVPQQFPRRLFEMLESETQRKENHEIIHPTILWSSTGKAFRIFDVAQFSTTTLPKYFRTAKFSSFQRNLNLVSSAAHQLMVL